MPDRYGFDHLGDQVRCIDCPTGGAIGHWPEPKRAAHACGHGRTTEPRRARNLLAVPPTTPSEEKEATTMATSNQGESAKQVAIGVLREAAKPLQAKEIAARVLASGRCAGLKGKTPQATISAMLAVGSKPGGPFTRVDKGTYALADIPAAAQASPKREPTAKPVPARKTAAARKTKSTAKTRTRRTAKRTR